MFRVIHDNFKIGEIIKSQLSCNPSLLQTEFDDFEYP
jgi:hypothetical protein